MERITSALEQHHEACDRVFSSAEEAAQRGDWSACGASFRRFREQLEAHFGVEEELLFPAFETRSGMTGGPLQVMRMEHRQMRELLEQLERAHAQEDADDFCGVSETLLVLMQQHNLKEENILYPMCDQALGQDTEDLRSGIEAGLADRGMPAA